MSAWRHLELTAERLPRWWAKFDADHPGVRARAEGGTIVLTSTDGSIARFTGWLPITEFTSDDDARRQLCLAPAAVGVILLRRGGYSIGLARGGELAAHKTGTRYVQSRTAAGGWSQQRFARRRENQAEDLIRAAGAQAVRILAPLLAAPAQSPDADADADAALPAGLAIGGDALLLDELLSDPRLRHLRPLPRREFRDIPDPRFPVLREVVRRCAAVRLAVQNP